MENETLETVPENFEDITIEYNEEGFYILGNGETISDDNPLPVKIIEPESSSMESEEEVTIQYYDEATASPQMELESVEPYTNNTRSTSVTDFKNFWKLSISGTTYDVLFPEGAPLEVVSGKLYNMGTSNITGAVIDNNFSDSSYLRKTITVIPLTTTNAQNTVYQNGSRCYITSYSPGQYNGLATSVQYVLPTVEERPVGASLTRGEWVISALLLFSVLVTILGGIFRR